MKQILNRAVVSVLCRWRRAIIFPLTVLFITAPPPAWAAEGLVRGKVHYEKILHADPRTGKGGLQLDDPVLTPVVGARVVLIDAATKQPIGPATATNVRGEYRISWISPMPPVAQIRVLATTEFADVVDHLNPKNVYFTGSDSWQLVEEETEKDVVARDRNRESGPFNILEVIRRANLYLKAADAQIKFGKIKIRWTTRPPDPKSRYYTSMFNPVSKEAHILGNRDEDSDEFDDCILLHEYGHFVMSTYARDDSPAGDHGRGMKLDPRLAWSEGWANFFACAVLNDPKYVDTGRGGKDPSVRLFHDYSQPIVKGDPAGYWSEYTVTSALWAIHKEVGFPKIWQVFTGPWKKRICGNLIDFCDILVQTHPDTGSKVASVLAARGINYTPGATPSVPGYRAPRPLSFDVPQFGTLDGLAYPYAAALDTAGFYTLTLSKKQAVNLHLDILRSKAPKNADLDLYLHAEAGFTGSIVNNGVKGFESLTYELEAGTYVVEVRSWFGNNRNTGTYRLQASLGTRIEGKLSARDGPILITNAESDIRGLVPGNRTVKLPGRVHEATLEAGKTYRIDVVSREPVKDGKFTFDPVVVVQNGDAKQLGFDDDSGGLRNARMTITADKSETYKIMVGAIVGQGSYMLAITPVRPPVQVIEVPPDGLSLVPKLDTLTKEIPFDLKLSAGHTYVIDMITRDPSALDPLLILEDADGTQLAEDDDGGGGRNARITFTARTDGVYRLFASSYQLRGVGDFTLEIRAKP